MHIDRYKEIDGNLDSSIRMALDQIRRFLRNGKASVMVGAGFSKNAIMDEWVNMADWNELCKFFYNELYGQLPEDKDLYLKSALRLAQQVECAKGRDALEELIKNSLPDEVIAPGNLHNLLVQLNWRDIFTTNYDTLLERAAKISYKHYNVVTSKKSLIYRPHPRIIKLHGSFPDNRPFIITEEDYRTYPTKFPEFVNTVRQALIETQFVLIGFSGDDPNFLSWLGWFRDFMEEEMLPIYLIHIGALPHTSEFQLMGKRKIHLIPTAAFSSDVSEALDFILSYIGDMVIAEAKWNGSLPNLRMIQEPSIPDLTLMMKKIRESYPNWLILPKNRINDFKDTWELLPFYQKKFYELSNIDEKIEFLSEVDWRLSVSYFPKWIEDTWYIKALEWVESIRKDGTELKYRYDALSLSLLQVYRQRGDDNKFQSLLNTLYERIKPSDSHMYRSLRYEEAIWHLQHDETELCKKCLDDWKVSPNDYRGVLWKARLLMEIGETQKATMILEQSIADVKSKLLMIDNSNLHLSALDLLTYSLNISNDKIPDTSTDKFPFFKDYIEFTLTEWKNEVSNKSETIHNFNINSSKTRWSLGPSGYCIKYVGACRYFQIAEEYGIPIGLPNKTCNSNVITDFLPWVCDINIKTGIGYLIESNSYYTFDKIINRDFFFKHLNYDGFNEIFECLWKSIEKYINVTDEKPSPREINVIIPLICRLCTMLDKEKIPQAIQIVLNLSNASFSKFGAELATLYNCLTIYERITLCWDLLSSPIKQNRSGNEIQFPSIILKEWQGSEAVCKIIEDALQSDDIELRRIGVKRLNMIYLILPPDKLKTIDDVININWDKLTTTFLPSYLGHLDLDITMKSWYTNFITTLYKDFTVFQTSETTKIDSSEPIYNFGIRLSFFSNSIHHLTKDQINSIIDWSLKFISVNLDSILKEDGDSFLGGLNHLWKDTLSILNAFISKLNKDILNSTLANDIIGVISQLTEKYPSAQSIAQLLTIDGTIMHTSRKKDQSSIRTLILNQLRSGDDNMIQDAFCAAVICYRNSNYRFGFQNIVEEVINHLHYRYDDVSVSYLKNLSSWIRSGIINNQRLSRLGKFLKEFPDKLMRDREIKADIKADILYFAGRLVGLLKSTPNQDLIQCYEHWDNYIQTYKLPLDIKNGFLYGQHFA